MKISVIFGTRPEAIKLAPVILALKGEASLECNVCVTGQHRHMLDQVLDVFGIKPNADLNLMEANQPLARLSARTIEAVDAYLSKEAPDLVLVQGDTTTVFCTSLAAFYRRIPVGHVEAGLRTWDLQAPWPEEANRVLATRLVSLHFAPTEWARENLLREAVPDETIVVTGNTVIDALLIALDKVRANPPEIAELPAILQSSTARNKELPKLVLITGHRRESFGRSFENICMAIAELGQRFPSVHFVYPVHLNPNVREPVTRILGNGARPQQRADAGKMTRVRNVSFYPTNIHLVEPLSYLPFVGLMDRATLILTDSGGVQEEAPSLGKPVLVMRDTTERPEAVAAGTARLVGADRERIINEVSLLLNDRAAYQVMAKAHNPYGDGKATPRIVKACQTFLSRVDKLGQ